MKTTLDKYSNCRVKILQDVTNEIDANDDRPSTTATTIRQQNHSQERIQNFLRKIDGQKFGELVKLSAIEL